MGTKIEDATTIATTARIAADYIPVSRADDSKGKFDLYGLQSNLGIINVKDYGAVGDGVTDDTTAIKAAVTAASVVTSSHHIYFPVGIYICSEAILVSEQMIIEGPASFSAYTTYAVLQFPDNCCGMVIHGATTTCDSFGYNQTTKASVNRPDGNPISGAGSTIRNLRIRHGVYGAVTPTVDGITHGFRARCTVILENVGSAKFAGDGFHFKGSAVASGDKHGDVSLSVLKGIYAFQNARHGVYVQGGDSNDITGIGVNCVGNDGCGIWDSSYLGCVWIGCHTSSNTGASYKSDTGRSVFVGCYEEDGQGNASIITPSIHVGGQSDVGYGTGIEVYNNCGSKDRIVLNRSGVNTITLTAAGSGYTSAPTVTFDAPSGATTATATATIANGEATGCITAITVTGGGAGSGSGYSTVPDAVITGDGTGATAEVFLKAGIVDYIVVTAEGQNYTNATVTIDAPIATTALGTAYLTSSATVMHIVATNRGAGYTSAPGITISGGGGSGATATCNLVSAIGSNNTVEINRHDPDAYTEIFRAGRDDVKLDDAWRLKEMAFSGDLVLDRNNGSTVFYVSGLKSTQNYGRVGAVSHGISFPRGLWLGDGTNARNIWTKSSIPTTGEYAKGDFVFNSNVSVAAGKVMLGWSRLVTGTAHVLNTDWSECYVTTT